MTKKGNRPEVDIPLDVLKGEQKHLNQPKNQYGIFRVKSANKWIDEAKNRPIPKMLFDVFWYEGEICILFADTNLGKSILAVQIGNSISTGKVIQGFQLEALQQAIIYFDFELSDKQFEARYSKDYKRHYKFHENFQRAEIDPDSDIPEQADFEHWIYKYMEKIILETSVKILIIDNITYLKNETEKAKNALPLMKSLKQLKSKYGLSILILAHTPKRDTSKPINRNDLGGSKMLINFCDSCFAIGESHQMNGVRYLKQIKARNTEIIYNSDNVAVCQIDKPSNFLQFEYMGYGTESEHLRRVSESEREEIENKIIELKQEKPNLSNREIAKQIGTNHTKVGRVLKRNNL